MTQSATRSASFTITDARYVGAKIGADLRLLNVLYGKPDLTDIERFAEEAALLLRDGYLDTVDFGFKNGDAWTLRIRYTATVGGQLVDSGPGSFSTTAAVKGLPFYSYLRYSAKFRLLTPAAQIAVEAALPVKRSGAPEPTTSAGQHSIGHGYGRNGVGVARDVYIAN